MLGGFYGVFQNARASVKGATCKRGSGGGGIERLHAMPARHGVGFIWLSAGPLNLKQVLTGLVYSTAMLCMPSCLRGAELSR